MLHERHICVALAFAIIAGCGNEPHGPPRSEGNFEETETERLLLSTAAAEENLRAPIKRELQDTKLWYDVDTDLANLAAWKQKWTGEIESVEMVGGCDCHVTRYHIRATNAAIDDFPKYDYDYPSVNN